jgi:hypothetical protein
MGRAAESRACLPLYQIKCVFTFGRRHQSECLLAVVLFLQVVNNPGLVRHSISAHELV